MKLLAWIDRQSSLTGLAIVMLIFIGAALIAAAGRVPRPIVQPTPALSSFIMVMTTPMPTVQPTADTTMLQEIAALKARVAELESAQSAPAPAPVYQTLSVEETAPTPTAFVADSQIEYSATGSTVQIEVPTDAPRLCTRFNDWRDYDAMYQSSPACHKAP